MIKAVIMVTGSAVALYALVLAVFYLFQEKIIFFPGLARFGHCPDMQRRGAKAESFGDIRYYIQKSPSPVQWIIIFHGNAGNACDRTYFLDLLEGFPANRVVFEYPGFGRDGKKTRRSRDSGGGPCPGPPYPNPGTRPSGLSYGRIPGNRRGRLCRQPDPGQRPDPDLCLSLPGPGGPIPLSLAARAPAHETPVRGLGLGRPNPGPPVPRRRG